MAYAQNLIGKRFGRLVVISRNYEKQEELLKRKGYHKAFWDCICDCGKTTTVAGTNLMGNLTKSCGCYNAERRHVQKNTKSIQWIVEEEITRGITNSGKEFIIDTDDFEKVKNYCWYISSQGYVCANSRNGNSKRLNIHRIVMDAKKGDLVDHKNWNKLDNRKSNLRLASKSQNNTNIKLKSNNTTGYPGITMNKSGSYVVRISQNGTRIYLGTYKNFEDAVKVRRSAEIELHGDWSGENNKQDYSKIVSEE